ncbi:DUF4262 domain-containing protein [Sinorhizobium meliloti]|nr:DUF4262 domain-containing protein [Sinorhizobium meliloti]
MSVDKVRQLIDKYGYYVQHVFADLGDGNPPYSYTDGLSYARKDKFPELVMACFEPQLMQTLLNDAVAAMKSGDLQLGGPRFYDRLIQDFDVAIVPIRHQNSTSLLPLPEDAEVYLIVLPDSGGLFPWDERCDPSFRRQLAGFDCIAYPGRNNSPPTTGLLH